MRMITKGTGFPVIVIPGIQGRWEWMAPTIDALQAGHRVISASLQEIRPRFEADDSLLSWMREFDKVIDTSCEKKVSLIGVSYGGLIAACYAARRPDRVTSLIMVSTPSPKWVPRPGDEFCLRHPILALPYFGVRALSRLLPEIYQARHTWPRRARVLLDHAGRGIRAPFSPAYAAQWIREWQAYDISEDCQQITAPTLLITGDERLDQVVPVERTREYLQLIPGATHTVLPGTGHIGLVTKPERFAEIAGQFIYAANTAERRAPQTEIHARHAS
jgi:pimeloyl-ACP methyl ester carboxylesterase